MTIVDTSRSWKPEVIADSSGKWYANGLAFATREEAEASARDLASHWFAVREWRAIESDQEPNYRWTKHGLEPLNERMSGVDV